ncbi:zinc-binding dehydrogenase [Phycicoccus sp. BSK3Z-2]|uniref:Zinc-binding dehydrogenase n=1 Tax=Phycicoccus avicenniae TaxID=2828860 RepID=A0A941HY05_9MICO|nr:zinc-binding dehydrogenase [Phycicoccus avicenniae]MBR7742418.1 zinc-binding dehydrogenase [Phycicoccus avicenniae]
MTAQTTTVLVPGPDGTWLEEERPAPTAGPGVVLVRSRYVAVNNADVAGMAAAAAVDEPGVAGYETAGEVVAVGAGVDESLLGTSVAACTPGAFAGLVAADARHTLPVPDGVPLSDAAALPTALLTEHGALRAGGFEPGRTVLVTGATSAIGLVGVRLAKALGASRVLATTRSAGKADLLGQVGADEVLVGTDDLGERVRALTGGEGVDLVLEHVAGDVLDGAIAATRPHGTVVQMGRLGGPQARVDVDALSFGRVTVVGVSYGLPDELAELLGTVREQVLPLVANGSVRPVVHEVLPWAGHAEAARLVRKGQAVGKVVLSVP